MTNQQTPARSPSTTLCFSLEGGDTAIHVLCHLQGRLRDLLAADQSPASIGHLFPMYPMCCFTNCVYAITQNRLLHIWWHNNWTFWQLACSWGGGRRYGIGQVCFKEKLPSKPEEDISPSLSKAVRTGKTKHRNITIIKEVKPHLWRDRVQHLSASRCTSDGQSEAWRAEREAERPYAMKCFSTKPKGRRTGQAWLLPISSYLPPHWLLPAHHSWRRLKLSP